MDFNQIEGLIDSERYIDAEEKLSLIINNSSNSEYDISTANYLMGYIHTCGENKGKVSWKAKKALLNCINSTRSIAHAFYLFAHLEEDKHISINYLKMGLNKFSKSAAIYSGLLKYSQKTERLKIIGEVKQKELTNNDLLGQIIQILISYNIWDDVDCFSDNLVANNDICDFDKNYFKLLSSYSKLLSKENEKVKDALNGFELLIEQDLSNSLCYSHYMGAIACSILLNDLTKVELFFDKLSVDGNIKDLIDGPDYLVEVDFETIYIPIFDELSKLFLNDKERKQKCDCLRALYLFSTYETFGTVRFKKKQVNDLKKYHKFDPDNLIVGCAMYVMQCEFKLYFTAYSTYIDMLSNNISPNVRYVYLDNAIENCSEVAFDDIYLDICHKLDSNLDVNMSILVPEVIDTVISRLWEDSDVNKKYKNIVDISERIHISHLKKSHKLFEIAYSYAEFMHHKAKEIYELLLDREPRNSSVLNNLGVIYLKNGKLIKAEEYFKKAHEINGKEEKYVRNLKDVSARLAKYVVALENVKDEQVWFIGKLNLLYNIADENREIQCTYRSRSSVLNVKPEKANELFDKMLLNNYIEKISDGNSNAITTYRINPLIKDFLAEKQMRIDNNKEYEKMTEKLNIDNLEDIGYTNELVNLLENVDESDFREILIRDLKECVVCLITGQYKSSIIMCGSIIEALLMNKIIEKSIDRYDIGELISKANKTKKVIDMDINELLFVADKENLVKKEHYHLSHFARSYRNIIHPACEIRKGIEISKENAIFMWNILIRIMKEVLLD